MEETFLDIIDKHQGIIYKISRMYRDHPVDQEDLFQDIVLQLWKSFPHFRSESKVSTWMYRIALNTAIASFRKKKLPIEYCAEIPAGASQTQTKAISDQEEQMYRALRMLDQAERAIISLYLEDYSYKEIADIIGMTSNNVGVKINRIKNKLKKMLVVKHDA